MNKRERVLRAIEFRGPDRVPFAGVPGVSDFFFLFPAPARDWQPDDPYYPNFHPGLALVSGWRYEKGRLPLNLMSAGFKRQDEFGCVWETGAQVGLGEVVEHPLASWDSLETFRLPDPRAPGRFDRLAAYRKHLAGGCFVLGHLENGLWERSHFLRGFRELLMDTVTDPDKVERLADRLLNEWMLPLAEEYARHGAHGLMMTDDWGMQRGLMIRPDTWRAIFKPRYARLFSAAHDLGMKFFMHSCGDIREIIPDLIEIGLDVLQKDDVCFMGLDALDALAGGRICFMGSLDVQRVMPGADRGKLYRETRRLLRKLAAYNGGYIGMYYTMPEAIGLTWKQMFTMRAAFFRHGRYPIQ